MGGGRRYCGKNSTLGSLKFLCVTGDWRCEERGRGEGDGKDMG